MNVCRRGLGLLLRCACSLFLACGSRSGISETETDAAVPVRELDSGVDASPDAASPDCDHDGDGYRAVACGGDDCRDTDAAYHPGARDEMGFTLWSLGPNWVGYVNEGRPHVLRIDEGGDGTAAYVETPDDSGEFEDWAPGLWHRERVATALPDAESSLTPDTIVRDTGNVYGLRVVFPGQTDGGPTVMYAARPGTQWILESIAAANTPVDRLSLVMDYGVDVTFSQSALAGIAHASRWPLEGSGWSVEVSASDKSEVAGLSRPFTDDHGGTHLCAAVRTASEGDESWDVLYTVNDGGWTVDGWGGWSRPRGRCSVVLDDDGAPVVLIARDAGLTVRRRGLDGAWTELLELRGAEPIGALAKSEWPDVWMALAVDGVLEVRRLGESTGEPVADLPGIVDLSVRDVPDPEEEALPTVVIWTEQGGERETVIPRWRELGLDCSPDPGPG